MLSTFTTTESRMASRPRAHSLRVTATPLPPILNIPAELVLSILEFAILECKPNTLATISKAISQVVDIILYRIVVLDSLETINLFYRTTLLKPRTFFAEHVKKIIVTWEFESPSPLPQIIATCPALRALIYPSCCRTISAAMQASDYNGLSELTLQSFKDEGASSVVIPPIYTPKSLTHLRFCEPSDAWYSPTFMLSKFGPLPHLSHLQLSRRANANAENDISFVEDIRTILCTYPALRLIIVTIFSNLSWGSNPQDSNIWNLVRDIQSQDQRVVITDGRYDQWKDEGVDKVALWGGWRPLDFWTAVRHNHVE